MVHPLVKEDTPGSQTHFVSHLLGRGEQPSKDIHPTCHRDSGDESADDGRGITDDLRDWWR